MYDKLKRTAEKELHDIEAKGKMTGGDLETAHKLTDLIKNIDKICMYEDDDGYSRMMHDDDMHYSGRRHYVRGHYSNDMHDGYDDRASSYAHRDMRGRYTRDAITDELHELMDKAGSDRERDALRMAIDKIGG